MEAMQVLYEDYFDLLRSYPVAVPGYGLERAYLLKKKREDSLFTCMTLRSGNGKGKAKAQGVSKANDVGNGKKSQTLLIKKGSSASGVAAL